MGDLRARNRAATSERILAAVQQVLAEEHPATLSMPQVAARAGVSLRTLYRYFPTKESLVDAASNTFEIDATAAVGGRPTLDTLEEYLRLAWRGFTDGLPAVRAQHLTPAGRELRARRLPRTRAQIRVELRARNVDLDDADLDRLVDLVVLLTSSTAYLELVDRLGHREDDAARLAAWATAAVVDCARR
ncbi:MAG: TetR/AcrR family transcriptional regulator [Actinomycetota bacterium]